MLYHVIRRSPNYNNNNNNNNNLNSPTKSTSNYKNGSTPKLMSRYHYSKLTAPQSASTSSESFFPRQQYNGQPSKPAMTTMATTSNNNNNNNQYSYSPFKSTFIPLVTNVRTMTPNKREFIQIPVTREDGAPLTSTPLRSVPITFISETTPLPTTANSNSANTYSKPYYTSLLRPGSKYTRHYATNNGSESSLTNIPRLPSVPRRLSLTVPVLTASPPASTASYSAKSDDESTKPNVPSSATIRQIPIQLTQPLNVASIPTNSSRISSAVLRSSSLTSNPHPHHLKRQRTDLGDISSSDFTSSSVSPSPLRRAEVMAREAIQGVARFQQQQQQNDSISDNPTMTAIRSPGLSRRVIVNLKSNQSVALDSRLSSANAPFSKPPATPSSSRAAAAARNNPYQVPILQEIQMPSHPATMAAEGTSSLPLSPFLSNRTHPNPNNSSFKNEFRMEIPVQVITNYEQENSIRENAGREDGLFEYEQPITVVTERILSANRNSNPALKSILKRSSSRDTIPRKNVSFMNA